MCSLLWFGDRPTDRQAHDRARATRRTRSSTSCVVRDGSCQQAAAAASGLAPNPSRCLLPSVSADTAHPRVSRGSGRRLAGGLARTARARWLARRSALECTFGACSCEPRSARQPSGSATVGSPGDGLVVRRRRREHRYCVGGVGLEVEGCGLGVGRVREPFAPRTNLALPATTGVAGEGEIRNMEGRRCRAPLRREDAAARRGLGWRDLAVFPCRVSGPRGRAAGTALQAGVLQPTRQSHSKVGGRRWRTGQS